ncbi:MAG: permease [Clostridiales bacterium]
MILGITANEKPHHVCGGVFLIFIKNNDIKPKNDKQAHAKCHYTLPRKHQLKAIIKILLRFPTFWHTTCTIYRQMMIQPKKTEEVFIMNVALLINIGIILFALAFAVVFVKDLLAHKADLKVGGIKSTVSLSLISVVALFFDTLGIGCYAPLTACYKTFKLVPDRLIPGTLNAACVMSMAFESIIFITVIEVETLTLVVLIGAAAIGAFIGAGFVSKLPVNKMRIGMGIALAAVVVTMLLGLLDLMPIGGEAIGITGIKLVISAVFCFIFGALMTIGVGAYAPIMALVYLMGLSPAVAFPIMMGSCAYLIPAAAIRFVREGSKQERPTYHRKAALITNTVGIIGAAVAAFLVTSLPLTVLKWLVVCVVAYTSIVMFRDGLKKKADDEDMPSTQATTKIA